LKNSNELLRQPELGRGEDPHTLGHQSWDRARQPAVVDVGILERDAELDQVERFQAEAELLEHEL
jgi:hypothetical protein